ncbi:MAG: hypothetical protein KDD62_08795, partial [Bdellovibrionales bacterium]|nr:hypothetical protein [Bdellovibrionales bacterium]
MTSLQFEFTRISFIDNTLTVAFEGRVVSRIKLSSLTFGIAHHQLQHCEQQKTSLPHTYNFATRLNLPVPEVPIHTLHLLYVGFDVSGNSYTGEVLIDWRKHQHFFEILNGRIHRKLQFPRVPQLEFRNPTRPLVCTPQEPIQLSACIAYSGSISQLAHCLEALLRCTSGTPEIFVYGAIDLDQEQALHSHFPGVHTLPFPDESSAKLLGRNKCCEVACGDLLLFMDDTLSIDPASKLPTDEQSNGSLFACGACILSPKGMVLHAGGICWQGAWPSFFVAQSFESDPLIQRTRETHFCSGGFIFISRQLFIQATMLPENLKTTTAQDCALGLQLRTMRQPIAYIPQLLVHSARSRLSQSIQASDYRYLQTHYPPLPRLWPSPFLTSSRDAVLLSTQHHRNLVLEYPLEPTPSFFP